MTMTGRDTPPRSDGRDDLSPSRGRRRRAPGRTADARDDLSHSPSSSPSHSPSPLPSTAGGPLRADDRAQAFTLEGFIASVVVLTAILFALQALVTTPTTGGQVDAEVRDDLGTQARDILVLSAHNGSSDLSHHVRRFSNESRGTWVGDSQSLARGYGSDQPLAPDRTVLGDALNRTFKQRGFSYNVRLEYLSETEPNETGTVPMVFRGVPTEEAVSVTYTIVLYDSETLTVPASRDADCANKQIEEIVASDSDFNGSGDCFFPIPEAELFDDDDNEGSNAPGNNTGCSTDTPACETGETDDNPIYNVVEVRVVVW